MDSVDPKHFRFCDLPRELRDKIYGYSLCSFAVNDNRTIDPDDGMMPLARAEHNVNVSLLCSNRQVNREAYTFMVKANRFVLVRSSGGIHMRITWVASRLPIVATKPQALEAFKDYALVVDLSVPGCSPSDLPPEIAQELEPAGFMMLARDLNLLCDSLADIDLYMEGISQRLQLGFTLGPNVHADQKTDPFATFCADKTQQALLRPFRDRIRGIKGVSVRGQVSPQLAKTVEQELTQDAYSDPKKVLLDLLDAKERALHLFRGGHKFEAVHVWHEASVAVDIVLRSSSWPTLVEKGGISFLDQYAEGYFLVVLNVIHAELNAIQKGDPNGDLLAAGDCLRRLQDCLGADHWKEGYRWVPSGMQRAKLWYRQAVYLRLNGRPDHVNLALSAIDVALRLAPGDAVILKEKENILEWKLRASFAELMATDA